MNLENTEDSRRCSTLTNPAEKTRRMVTDLEKELSKMRVYSPEFRTFSSPWIVSLCALQRVSGIKTCGEQSGDPSLNCQRGMMGSVCPSELVHVCTGVSLWPALAAWLCSPCRPRWRRCSWAQTWTSKWRWDRARSWWWRRCCSSWTWWKAPGSCPRSLRCRQMWSGHPTCSRVNKWQHSGHVNEATRSWIDPCHTVYMSSIKTKGFVSLLFIKRECIL